jgi:hypothetical protein
MSDAPLVALASLGPRVIDFVWKPLQKATGQSITEKPTKLKLAEVKDFGTLVTESQQQGKPIWDVAGGSAESKAHAKRLFSDLAKRIIEATD